ncbi:MAG: hypothetical protein ABIY51_12345 [Ferruginibacter sp.]
MKKIFFLLQAILLLAVFNCSTSHAQKVIRKGVKTVKVATTVVAPNFELEQLSGKWQEWKRISLEAKQPIAFTDTLMLNFNKRNGVEVRDGVSMALAGEAAIEKPNRLLLAGDSYTISSLNNNNLVINDGEFIRYLKKKKAFYYESLGNIQVFTDDLSVSIKPNLSVLAGKWEVYRRQAAPGFIREGTDKLIKSLLIKTPDENGVATGEINLYTNAGTENIPCTIKFIDKRMHIDAGDSQLDYNIFKTALDEFVFGRKGGLVYFSKKL